MVEGYDSKYSGFSRRIIYCFDGVSVDTPFITFFFIFMLHTGRKDEEKVRGRQRQLLVDTPLFVTCGKADSLDCTNFGSSPLLYSYVSHRRTGRGGVRERTIARGLHV